MVKRMEKTNGNEITGELKESLGFSFVEAFEAQMLFQHRVLLNMCGEAQEEYDFCLPCDVTKWFEYHTLAMMEEIGEVLRADKRWKTHRSDRYEPEEKKDELADVFITFMNMCIFSGFGPEEIYKTIIEKIHTNNVRLDERLGGSDGKK